MLDQFMIELFTDVFTRKQSLLHAVDARVKLFVILPCLLAVILSQTPVFSLLITAAASVAIVSSGVPLRYFLLRMSGPAGLVLILGVIYTFTTGTIPLFSIQLGSFLLTATRDGLLGSILIVSRVLGAVSLVLLIGITTPAYSIFSALRWMRIPADWVELAQLMYRYIFLFTDTASDIATAQRVRLGYKGWRRSISSLGILVGAVLTASLDQAVRTSESMRLRGYSGQYPFAKQNPLCKKDIMLALTINSIVWGLWAVIQHGGLYK